jgi:phosphonate transport system permease protein
MTTATHRDLDDMIGTRWRRPPMVKRQWLRWTLAIGFLAYLVAAFASVEVNWLRVWEGLDRGGAFVAAFASPDFTSRSADIWSGILESIVMTVAASVVGILISIPIALGAARNIAPLPIYMVCRSIIAISRALQEIIVAILLVAIFGFGPLAGFLTLSFASIGFLSKLLAEDIGRGCSCDWVEMGAVGRLRCDPAGASTACWPVNLPRRHQLSRKCDSWACWGRGHWRYAEHCL